MENPAEFDLNTAIREWRKLISQSPALGEESLNELEAHLRDSIASLQSKELSGEEAFLIATHRLGTVKTLEPEFAKSSVLIHAKLARFRAPWLVVNLVVSAVITPDGNPWNMVLMALPMQALFELVIWMARYREQPAERSRLMNQAVHGLILVVFSIACVVLYGMLTGIMHSSARAFGGEMPAFARLCIACRPLLLVLPLLAAAYCLFVWIRRSEPRNSWVGFFATSMVTLILVSLPTFMALFVYMSRYPTDSILLHP